MLKITGLHREANKTTLRYDLTLVRMTIARKVKNNKCQ